MSILYPAGWGGEHSLSSGFTVITGSATGSTTLTFSGQSVSAVNTLITQEIQNNRKYCSTGDPSYFTTGEIVNLTETGYFYGYC
jgi:poly(3-hydroxyalkanoate) synthetase